MTNLERATERVLSAIAKSNFKELEEAMKQRGELLAAGAEVTPRAWELGDEAHRALSSLRQKLLLDSSRLEQVKKIGASIPSRHLEYFG